MPMTSVVNRFGSFLFFKKKKNNKISKILKLYYVEL